MLSLRTSSPFDLFDRLEQQLNQQLHQSAERVPAAEVHETPEAYDISLELPGVDRDAIDVKATDRSLVISAERRSSQQAPDPQAGTDDQADTNGQSTRQPNPLISEFRYGTWSRSFRFPAPIDPQQLHALYRDGVLTVSAPKAQTVTSVAVKVEG